MSVGDRVLHDISSELETVLNKCGIMYRIFYRAKSELSIERKLKNKKYDAAGKRIQDFLALRVTLYFTDDVKLVYNYLKGQPNFDNESVDVFEVDKFRPERLNIVMRIPDKCLNDMICAIQDTGHGDLIDTTYEVQIRTILSEGWHEVEHDLRYKCQDDWADYKEESRLLNGIYASLESSEWAMLALFDRLSYSQYKMKAWNSMLRNKMRVRFASKELSAPILRFLNDNLSVAKDIFRANRSEVLQTLMSKNFSYPLTYDTVLHLVNRIVVRSKDLSVYEDNVFKKDMDLLFGEL